MKKAGWYYRLVVVTQVLLFFTVLVLGYFAPAPPHFAMKHVYAEVNGGLKTALGMFEIDCGRFPSTEENFTVLVSPSTNVENWHGPYFDPPAIPEDAWGHEYVYRFPGVHNTNGYDLYSLGPDGVSKSGGNDLDDINNWEELPHGGTISNTLMLFEMAYKSLLLIPFLFVARVVAGIISPRVCAVAMENGLADWIWFTIAVITTIIIFLPTVVGKTD